MKLGELVLTLSFAVPACAVDTLPIATLDMSDAGDDDRSEGGQDSSRRDEGPTACRSNDDCDAGEYCEKPCDPGLWGTCLPIPTVCPPSQEAPVCGCDRFTYFDDCLRRRKGAQLAMLGDCPTGFALGCGTLVPPCPESAYCAKLFVSIPCPPDAPGKCWIMPSTCGAPAGGGDRWNACGTGASGSDVGSGGTGDGDLCVDTCAAIQSEQPHVRADRCES